MITGFFGVLPWYKTESVRTFNPRVVGSSPTGPTLEMPDQRVIF
jgi:hypothetical protein